MADKIKNKKCTIKAKVDKTCFACFNTCRYVQNKTKTKTISLKKSHLSKDYRLEIKAGFKLE